MKVFVTGGSGFVGGHVIERLAPEHSVLAMARSDRSAEKVKALGADPVRCDLESVGAEHLSGVDAVIHAAAFVEEWGSRDDFYSANVEGTTRLLDAAKAAKVGRFIHVGTEAVCFDGHDLVGIDETHPYPPQQRFLYSETKAEAERRVLGANSSALTTLSIRPRLVWGPRDQSVLPAVLRMIEEGSFVWLDGGRALTSSCHVANLTEALTLALSEGQGGEAYFVADDGERSVREFLTALVDTRGVGIPDKSVPGWLVRPLAQGLEVAWRALRRRGTPPLTHFAVAMMSRTVTVRDDKARTQLGYRPRLSFEEGLQTLRAS